MGTISIGKLLIIAVIVVLLFGTNKLRTLGSDLGSAIKGFKKALGDDAASSENNHDADFVAKSVTEQAEETKIETKTDASKNKEQV